MTRYYESFWLKYSPISNWAQWCTDLGGGGLVNFGQLTNKLTDWLKYSWNLTIFTEYNVKHWDFLLEHQLTCKVCMYLFNMEGSKPPPPVNVRAFEASLVRQLITPPDFKQIADIYAEIGINWNIKFCYIQLEYKIFTLFYIKSLHELYNIRTKCYIRWCLIFMMQLQ